MTDERQENQEETGTLVLPEQLTIALAGDFKQQLASRVQRGGDITVDASQVTRIDTAFIQLLFSIQCALSAHGGQLRWDAISPEFGRSVELVGLRAALALPN